MLCYIYYIIYNILYIIYNILYIIYIILYIILYTIYYIVYIISYIIYHIWYIIYHIIYNIIYVHIFIYYSILCTYVYHFMSWYCHRITQVEVQRAAARALRSVPCGPSWIPVTKVLGETLRSSVANRDVTAAVQTMGISPGFIGPNL